MKTDTIIFLNFDDAGGHHRRYYKAVDCIAWVKQKYGQKFYPHYDDDGKWKFVDLPLKKQLDCIVEFLSNDREKVTWDDALHDRAALKIDILLMLSIFLIFMALIMLGADVSRRIFL